MSLLLYAIADGSPGTLEQDGLEHGRLKMIGQPGLVAVVAETATPSSTARAMWEHEEVIERLMASCPVLPARFGTVLADEHEAEALLARRGRDLGEALELVRDAMEVGVRAQWLSTARLEDDEPSGTEYMRTRLQQLHRAREVAAALEPLGALARRRRVTVAPRRPEVAVAAAYLVDRCAAETFVERVAELDRGLEHVALVCTGPWPPYSFVEGAVQ